MNSEVTIRFSHVDPAGIAFYPRFFEILTRHFADTPWTNPPLAIQTEFFRPIRLGDRVSIDYKLDDNGWSYTGSLHGADHFRISSLSDSRSKSYTDKTDGQSRIVTTEEEVVGSWATDDSGRMQLSRYFELVSEAQELWIEDIFRVSYYDFHVTQKLAIPTAKFETNVHELPRLGDKVFLQVHAAAFGTKSLTLRSRLMRSGDCLIENDQILVFVDASAPGLQSIPIPGRLRADLKEQANVAT